MGQETREDEIERLERRLAELRSQQEQEKVTVRVRGGRVGRAPMPGPEAPPPPPLPKLEIEVEAEASAPQPSEAPRKRTPKRKSRSHAKKAKRLEQAVVGLVIVFFGGCMALVATQGKGKSTEEEKTAEAPKSKPSADGKGEGEGEDPPPEDDDNLAPDPGGVCQMLVSAGVAKSCGPSETAGEGERVAVFELAGDEGGTGRVRTFDSSARCQQAGGPGGGHWYARCDALTAIVIPSHTNAEGTLAARRVAARL